MSLGGDEHRLSAIAFILIRQNHFPITQALEYLMNKWFHIQSVFTQKSGLTLSLNGKQLQLTVDDVCYLLRGVDGHATASVDSPPPHIGFMFDGVHYVVTNEEWSQFIDELQNVAGSGGWTALSCSKT
jgi:hypothetical protein